MILSPVIETSILKKILKLNIKLCGVCTKSSRSCEKKKNESKGVFPWGNLDHDSVIQDHSDHGAKEPRIHDLSDFGSH